MPPDNHNHFLLHGDAGEMVAAAAAAGVGEIAFTEHVFHIDEARARSRYIATRFEPEGPPVSHEAYVAAIDAVSATAKIRVRRGIELDVRAEDPAFEAATMAFRTACGGDWDLVIGSVHVIAGDESVEGEPISHPSAFAWSDYLDRLVAAAASERYDVIAHPVRLARSVPDAPATLPARLDELAAVAADHDVALELNGTDLQRRPDLVELLVASCARHATPVSLGSDAHLPNTAGRALAGIDLLRRAGIRTVAAFDRRARHAVVI